MLRIDRNYERMLTKTSSTLITGSNMADDES